MGKSRVIYDWHCVTLRCHAPVPSKGRHAFGQWAYCTLRAAPSMRAATVKESVSDSRGLRGCSRIRSGLEEPHATGGGNKDADAHHWAVILALWRSHCQARIGLQRSIVYYHKLLFSVARDTQEQLPIQLSIVGWDVHHVGGAPLTPPNTHTIQQAARPRIPYSLSQCCTRARIAVAPSETAQHRPSRWQYYYRSAAGEGGPEEFSPSAAVVTMVSLTR